MALINEFFRKTTMGVTLLSGYIWNRYIKQKTIKGPPCFIVGCGNSGTSILLSILGAHSRIYAVGYESHVGAHPGTPRILKWFDFLALANGKVRWVEKTPRNIYHIDKLLACSHGAKVVMIIRDGRDVAFSIKKRSGSLEKGIHRWIEDNEAGRKYAEHPDVLVVRYEDLIENFEKFMTQVLSFIGEEYEANCREFHKTKKYFYSRNIAKPHSQKGHHRQFRNWQINQPLFDGRGQWKQMSPSEIEYVSSSLEPLLIEYGYMPPSQLNREVDDR